MSPQRQTCIALAVLLVALPVAAAQGLPSLPTDTTTAPPAPTAPTAGATTTDPPTAPATDLPTLPTAEAPPISIDEALFTFQGSLDEPHRIVIRDLEGATAFEYAVDEDGRARLDVAGENVLADATLVRVDGDPLGDAFVLTLRDAEGQEHEVQVDRAALQAEAPLPEDVPLPELGEAPIEVLRPLGWPDAPTESYLVYVEDVARNHLAAASLDGTPYVQRAGQQLAVVQVPLAEMKWDRILLRANVAGSTLSENSSFTRVRDTDTAAIFHANYALDPLGAADGDTVEFRVVFERRVTPLLAERIPEPVVYEARVDGLAPTVRMQAPATADDLHVALAWSGSDAHSGLGGFNVQYRLAGAQTWTNWLAPTKETGATFSGAWGQTYEFRTFALDRVGLPSPIPATATTRFVAQSEAAEGADELNDPPVARILTPRAGDLLAGAVRVTWDASDPDGTPVTSRLQLSNDDGATWRTLFAGLGTSYDWDTGTETDGTGYRLRLSVTDGTQSEGDALSGLSVQNVAAPADPPVAAPKVSAPGGPVAPTSAAPQAAPTPGAEPEAPAPEGADDADAAKGTPMPSLALVAGALAGAALLARRRRA